MPRPRSSAASCTPAPRSTSGRAASFCTPYSAGGSRSTTTTFRICSAKSKAGSSRSPRTSPTARAILSSACSSSIRCSASQSTKCARTRGSLLICRPISRSIPRSSTSTSSTSMFLPRCARVSRSPSQRRERPSAARTRPASTSLSHTALSSTQRRFSRRLSRRATSKCPTRCWPCHRPLGTSKKTRPMLQGPPLSTARARRQCFHAMCLV
eukprot:Amastigsp_a174681_558.p2 type:complete len:211 gc:universal Amastigsp_a174681_558:602-1234(+)